MTQGEKEHREWPDRRPRRDPPVGDVKYPSSFSFSKRDYPASASASPMRSLAVHDGVTQRSKFAVRRPTYIRPPLESEGVHTRRYTLLPACIRRTELTSPG